MSAQTQQQTDARIQATMQRVVGEALARLRADQLTHRNMLTERADKFEAAMRADFIGLQLQLNEMGAVIRSLASVHAARLERPWWKRLLSIGRDSVRNG